MEETIEWHETAKIKALLVGRSVVEASSGVLTLDDGTQLEFSPNDGCGGCSAGNFWINEILESPVNMIMNVVLETEAVDGVTADDPYGYEDGEIVRMFILTENTKIKMLEVEGDRGNGYYGSGFWIEVKKP